MGRNAIAGMFAALVVLAVALAGWQLVDSRVNQPEAAPEPVIAAVATALETGAGLEATLRLGAPEVQAALEAVMTVLKPSEFRVEVSELVVTGAEASARLTYAAMTDVVGAVTWQADVRATRVRGAWGVDADATLIHTDMRPGYLLAIERNEPSRAPILGHDGTALTSHGAAWSLGIAPGRVVNPERLRTTWASVLPGSLDELVELLERTDTNPDWFYPLVTITESTYEQVWPRLRAVPGTVARASDGETPTDDAFARHVVGRVGEPTAEQAAELDVDPSSRVGLYGLERVFEDQLVGSTSVRVLITQPDGDEVALLATLDDDPATPLETTLDADIQQAVENALAGVDEPIGFVIVDASTGAIRGSASRPLGGYNRAWEGRYAPGDAFLPVAAEAVLGSGVDLDDPTECVGRESVAGALLLAPRAIGSTTVATALAAGCDTTLGRLVADLGTRDLMAAATRFGFDWAGELALPSVPPSFPEPIDLTERVRAGAGQGRVLASPLHMASVAAAAVTGRWSPPFLLVDDAALGASVAVQNAAGLRRLLEEAASRTGSGATIGELGGIGIIGTAPVTGSTQEHAWALFATDELAGAVLVEEGAGASTLAADVTARFLRELAVLRR